MLPITILQALMRNKEQQLHLLQQSMQNAPRPPLPQQGMVPQIPTMGPPPPIQQKPVISVHHPNSHNVPLGKYMLVTLTIINMISTRAYEDKVCSV